MVKSETNLWKCARLCIRLALAVTLALFPVSISVASNAHGFGLMPAHGSDHSAAQAHVHQADDAAQLTKTDCKRVDPSSSKAGGDANHMSGQCCAGFCAASVMLVEVVVSGPDMYPQSHMALPHLAVLAGEWAVPHRPPNS